MKKRYIVGSCRWFSEYRDYVTHDKDVLYVCGVDRQMLFKNGSTDIIMLPTKESARDYVDEILSAGIITRSTSLYCGKFLCPEFAKDFGMTMQDLELIKPHIYATDARHQYQRVILDSYLENGDFVLTKEQRDKAYMVYKEARKDLYRC